MEWGLDSLIHCCRWSQEWRLAQSRPQEWNQLHGVMSPRALIPSGGNRVTSSLVSPEPSQTVSCSHRLTYEKSVSTRKEQMRALLFSCLGNNWTGMTADEPWAAGPLCASWAPCRADGTVLQRTGLTRMPAHSALGRSHGPAHSLHMQSSFRGGGQPSGQDRKHFPCAAKRRSLGTAGSNSFFFF